LLLPQGSCTRYSCIWLLLSDNCHTHFIHIFVKISHISKVYSSFLTLWTYSWHMFICLLTEVALESKRKELYFILLCFIFFLFFQYPELYMLYNKWIKNIFG
jgi:hypothetical protein